MAVVFCHRVRGCGFDSQLSWPHLETGAMQKFLCAVHSVYITRKWSKLNWLLPPRHSLFGKCHNFKHWGSNAYWVGRCVQNKGRKAFRAPQILSCFSVCEWVRSCGLVGHCSTFLLVCLLFVVDSIARAASKTSAMFLMTHGALILFDASFPFVQFTCVAESVFEKKICSRTNIII